mmetsp:Transcript_13880/g.26953  ORF Transcript_13880/g.26953 Transcript_13880/m.26953 type:complete len:238 (+) Transcript_13880:962-1675(+)
METFSDTTFTGKSVEWSPWSLPTSWLLIFCASPPASISGTSNAIARRFPKSCHALSATLTTSSEFLASEIIETPPTLPESLLRRPSSSRTFSENLATRRSRGSCEAMSSRSSKEPSTMTWTAPSLSHCVTSSTLVAAMGPTWQGYEHKALPHLRTADFQKSFSSGAPTLGAETESSEGMMRRGPHQLRRLRRSNFSEDATAPPTATSTAGMSMMPSLLLVATQLLWLVLKLLLLQTD